MNNKSIPIFIWPLIETHTVRVKYKDNILCLKIGIYEIWGQLFILFWSKLPHNILSEIDPNSIRYRKTTDGKFLVKSQFINIDYIIRDAKHLHRLMPKWLKAIYKDDVKDKVRSILMLYRI